MIYSPWSGIYYHLFNFKNTTSKQLYLLICIGMIMLSGCQTGNENNEQTEIRQAGIQKESFGKTQDGEAVDLYTLTNANGVEAKITNYGGVIVSLKVPDKNGNMEDVVLGFDSLAPYETESPYFGSIVGRYGNRIAKGKFTLDGQEYTLVQNNMGNHLHGGTEGFDKKVWKAAEIKSDSTVGLKLTYTSPDMEEGYPGKLDVEVTYTLRNDDALAIGYKATTDKKTIVNLTNHSYFNLTGNAERDILDHVLMINASQFVPVDSTLIPTGELRSVEGTPFDFEEPIRIGERINNTDDQQIAYGGGYDHCWVLNKDGEGLTLAATVYEPNSGRFMEVMTTEPGVQFYSGNFLDGSLKGKGNVVYEKRYGLCLETQHFPDSPNQPDFPSVELNSGETYQTSTVYKFSVREEQ